MVLRAQRRIPGKFWSLLANFMFQFCSNCSTQSRLTGWDSFHLMISVVSVSGSGIGYQWHLVLGTLKLLRAGRIYMNLLANSIVNLFNDKV